MLEGEDIAKELSGLPREVDDKRQKGQQKETAAAAEKIGRSVDRAGVPVDRHAQHAQGS